MTCPGYYRLLFALGCLVLMTATMHAQDVRANSEEQDSVGYNTVKIIKAKQMNYITSDTSEVAVLTGDIEITQDSIFMKCDSAIVKDQKDVSAYGNVIIQKGDSLTIFADTLKYHSDSLWAQLDGEVILLFNEDQMWTSRLDYDLDKDIAYYYQEAVLINDSVQISSRQGYYNTRSSQARFIDSVVVISDKVTLLADSLDYNTKSKVTGFLGPTLIYQNTARIYCEDGFYDVDGELAEFRENAEYKDGPKLASADTIRYEGATGAVYLKGNAHYVEDDKVIDSRELLFYEESGETLIIGDAVFRDSTRYAEADTIRYNRNTENLSTVGRSTVIEGPQTLVAEKIDFDQKSGEGIARGNVFFQDTSSNIIILCDTALLHKETEFVKAYGMTRPMMKTVVDEDTLYLTADTLQSERRLDSIYLTEVDTIWHEEKDTFALDTSVSVTVDSFRQFVGHRDVRLFKGTLQGKCDSIAFDSRDSLFRLIGSPIMWSDTTQFTADTITMVLIGEALDHVNLIQNAMIISEVKGLFYNQIKGKRMKARLVESELKDLHVWGNAQSVYYAMDEDGAFIGVNKVVASEIFFTFEKKQLSGIRFYSQPDGVMTPMIDVNHNEMRLEGFTWRDDIRPKVLEDLF